MTNLLNKVPSLSQRVKDEITVFLNDDIIPKEAALLEPDFEDDRTNDKALEAELDDLFGDIVSGRNLDDISDDEWEALRDD